MAEQKTDSPAVPLPDPDRVQKAVDTALERFREKRGLYYALGFGVLALLIVALVWANLPEPKEESAFGGMWQRAETIQSKFRSGESALADLTELETYVAGIDDVRQAGVGKWILANCYYKEASASKYVDFADKKPHLEKALAFAKELGSGAYDQVLVTRTKWFTTESTDPVAALRERLESDLEFGEKHQRVQPKPDEGLTAVLRTSEGDIYFRFFRKLAPKHVDNFVKLATAGVYNGTAFHFVGGGADPIAIHGGDPYSYFYNAPLDRKHITRWGTGTLGYQIAPEEARFKIDHRPGIVSSMRPDRSDWDNAVLFQILLAQDSGLDRIHTPFAQVVEGLDIAKKAAARTTASQHEAYRDDAEFSRIATRDLIVDPVWIHKVIIFGKDRAAVEHAYPLAENERQLGKVKDAPVKPLEGEALRAGRKLRDPRTADVETIRRGLDVPFPRDVDTNTADPLGDRRKPESASGDGAKKDGAAKDKDGDDSGDGGKDAGGAKEADPKDGDSAGGEKDGGGASDGCSTGSDETGGGG